MEFKNLNAEEIDLIVEADLEAYGYVRKPGETVEEAFDRLEEGESIDGSDSYEKIWENERALVVYVQASGSNLMISYRKDRRDCRDAFEV